MQARINKVMIKNIFQINLLIVIATTTVFFYAANGQEDPVPWWLRVPRGQDYVALREKSPLPEDKSAVNLFEGLIEATVAEETKRYDVYIDDLQKRLQNLIGNNKRADKSLTKTIALLEDAQQQLAQRELLRSSDQMNEKQLGNSLGIEIKEEINRALLELRKAHQIYPTEAAGEVIKSLIFFYKELQRQSASPSDPLKIGLGNTKDRRWLVDYFSEIESLLGQADEELDKGTMEPVVFTLSKLVGLRSGDAVYKTEEQERLDYARGMALQLREIIAKGVDKDYFWNVFYNRLLELQKALDIEGVETDGFYVHLLKQKTSSAANATPLVLKAGENLREFLFYLLYLYEDVDEWPYISQEALLPQLRKKNTELRTQVEKNNKTVLKLQEIDNTLKARVDELKQKNQSEKEELDNLLKEIEAEMKNK